MLALVAAEFVSPPIQEQEKEASFSQLANSCLAFFFLETTVAARQPTRSQGEGEEADSETSFYVICCLVTTTCLR